MTMQTSKPHFQWKLWLFFSARLLPLVNIGLLVLILLMVSAWLWLIPRAQRQVYKQEEQLATLQEKHQQLRAVPKQVVANPNSQRLNRFYEQLGEKKYVEQEVNTIFTLANEAGLILKTGDYQLAEVPAGQYYTYHVQLPLKGSYQQLRKFAEQVLLAIPYASLDDMSFKRDAISNNLLDSKVVLTIFVSDAPHLSPGQME